ncbi:TIGR00159 family protein [Desulfonauticus submarinus]|uniref:Diadenylate cyclase n=1 Tax=Desulfonauticus submarinus TaxID=206665 RepID=A0A1H0EJ03_9BACT|nr:diadenylate cyclase CdaA [Desulfonauticus submarinus]SDN82290.1 TIGR00159 family protein [Desulfonauticus submarinus]
MSVISFGGITISWRDILDILIVSYLFYLIIVLVKGTRAVAVIYGLAVVIVFYFLAGEFGFYTLHWLLGNFLSYIFLVIVILFQKDIRRALAVVGAKRIFSKEKIEEKILDELVLALVKMAEKRIGAIVVLEKNIPLGDIIERGVEVKAKLSKELLLSIFYPGSPLHDGAVILRKGKIEAAGCVLPLAVGIKHRSDLGTRHRAAIGLTEECDAVSIVVSEERGTISVAIGGKLTSALDEVRLRRVVQTVLER